MASPGVSLAAAMGAGAAVGHAPSAISPSIVKPGLNLGWGPDVPTLLHKSDGSFCLNADKHLVKWRWIPARFQDRLFPVTFSANESTDLDVQIGAGSGTRGDVEIGSFMLVSTGRVAVRPYVSSPIDKYLSNVEIPSNLMFGTAQLPGMLMSSIYSMSNTFWRLTTRNMTNASNTISAVLWGRKFTDRGREFVADQRRRAELLSIAWPYWIGPQAADGAGFSGPAITLSAGETVTLRFPATSSADFLLKWILDDSTSTTGVEPVLFASIQEEDTKRGLVDYPYPIRWRDFLACPTVSVTGFPSGGFIRAFSLGSPRGGYTHLLKRTSAFNITFRSEDAGTITLRTALAGWNLAAREPEDRHYSNDLQARDQRIQQAGATQAVRMFGDPRKGAQGC